MIDIRYAAEVAAAKSAGTPIVALESTIITHGMPYPQNVETARLVEDDIRATGAVPATIAVLDGVLHIGLEAAALDALGQAQNVAKLSRADFAALAATLLVTLGRGVESGIIAGVAVSVLLHLWATSRPHVAVIGQVPGTQHFRNVRRHDVVCMPDVLGLRIDESLFFANARAIENVIQQEVAARPELRHVVLNCAAVNSIDASALESLELVMHRLDDAGIRLHLSEVKGPVMDRLKRSDFLHHLTGDVFLSHYRALEALAPSMTRRCQAIV